MSHSQSVAWLKITAWGLIATGVYFSWALASPLNALGLGFLDLAIWPLDGAQSYEAAETRLAVAIIGGLTVGVGAVILMITKRIYAADPKLGGALILAFALPWCAVDSIGSVIAGAWFNAVINLVVLAAIITPVLLRREAAAE